MLNKSVARRYAEAFFSIAREANKIDDFQQELEKIVATIDQTENLKEYFAHLLIPAKAKKEVATKIFGNAVSQLTLNFLLMIIDKRRENYIGVITEEYKDMADESRNITKADLIAAVNVPDEDIKTLADKLSASMGRTVQLKLKVDQSLIGGLKLKIGDQIIDGTVAKRLQMLRNKLIQAKIS
ncbi:MAG: ATP synthase F1 subunit delta [Syntrophomonas sp.]